MPNRAQRRLASRKGVKLDPPAAKPKIISLGYVYSEKLGVAGRWHQSVVKFMASASAAGYAVRELPVETGPFLTAARNKILRKHLAFGDDYLLFTDTDIVFTPEDVGLLMAADAAIAGAHYLTAASSQQPWSTALVEGEGDQPEVGTVNGKSLTPFVLPELPPQPEGATEDMTPEEKTAADAAMGEWIGQYMAATQPVEVMTVGFGLTLLKHEVVKTMCETYEHPIEYVGELGEDVIFCEKARECGFKVMLVPQARVGHLKVLEV